MRKDSKGEESKNRYNGSAVTVTDKDDDLPRKITLQQGVSSGGTKSQALKLQIYKGDGAGGINVKAGPEADKLKISTYLGTFT